MQGADWGVLALYATAVIAIGWWAGRKEKSIDDFFLAGRQMPWLMVMVSIFATSASALTFIGVPGVAYASDFNYVSLGLGSIVGRFLIAGLLLNAYYKGRVITVYQLLGQRFGPRSRDAGTSFFIITRLLASGVRLAGCAIALHVVFQISMSAAIAAVAILAMTYTALGGIKAVMFTDLLQFIVFMGSAVFALGYILHALPGGFDQFVSVGSEGGKFNAFVWEFSLNNPKSFLAGSLFGCFATFAALGTDQDLVQRMLTARSARDSQKAIIFTGLIDVPIMLLFLSIGAGLYVYYQAFPDPALAGMKPDHIFPYFIKTVMPVGIRGILLAALLAAAMSSLDSALNALSSSAVVDFYARYLKPTASQDQQLRMARMLVFAFAVILALIALLFSETHSILWLGFKSVGYTYGGLLGIFLLAVLTDRRGEDRANVVAMVSSVLVALFATSIASGPAGEVGLLLPWQDSAVLKPLLAWPWGLVLATVWTFFFGAAFSKRK